MIVTTSPRFEVDEKLLSSRSRKSSAFAKRGILFSILCLILQDNVQVVTAATSGFAMPHLRPSNLISKRRMYTTKKMMTAYRNGEKEESSSRRKFMLSSLPLAVLLGARSEVASSMGLMQFPCKDGFMNTYHFMRAGQSLLEEQDLWQTNPLFSTSREAKLSSLGIEQAQQACKVLMDRDINPSLVKFTLAANAMDTAEIVASEMKVGRDRLVPEYTYMDPRGIGEWNMLPLQSTEAAVWAMDMEEAGALGKGGNPPPHYDGTPNETLSNQVTRLTQLMSLLESVCSGDTILLIFPDGTGPAVLSCLIGGIPLNRAHELELKPGELRFDVTMENTLKLLPEQPTSDYLEIIKRGKETLEELREESILESSEQVVGEKQTTVDESGGVQSSQVAKQTQKVNNEEAFGNKKDDGMALSKPNGPGILSTVFSLGGLGLAGWMAGWKDKPVETKQDLTLENANGRGSPNSDTTAGSKSVDSPELISMEDKIKSAQFDIPEMSMQPGHMPMMEQDVILEDETVGRTLIATKAMEEYLDQDDGGEAWLNVMSELMEEDA